jgi:hypothetical protein
VRDAIAQCPTVNPIDGQTCTAGALTYTNTGSGAAETALQASPTTQRIAPMSRNFKGSVLTAHPGWAPQLQNIIGLDAAVVVEKSAASGYSKCADLAAALDGTLPGHAQIDTLIGLVLGGKGGLGDTASCSHPDRLAALDTLAGCFGGVSFIDHFYRRDDRSGTADTMKEKFRVSRFCNGRAPGLVAGLDNNMANDDYDPIRRDCIGADSSHAQTPCTLYPATTACTATTPPTPGCTQGLVVPLSQNDPGMPDITTSIARRVRLDSSNATIGFAGREASRQTGNAAPSLNGISPNNLNVRSSAYLASRRLFVNWSDQPIGTGRTGGPNADDQAREAEELKLFTWMTDPGLGGRSNLDPILVTHGFLPCTDNYSDPSGPTNLCSSVLPPPVAETTPGQCIPDGLTGDGKAACCSQPNPTSSTVSTAGVACGPSACRPVNYACAGSGQGNCCTGLACTDLGDGSFACN